MQKAETERSPRVLAVVLNWNGADDTVQLIRSLEDISYPALDVLIVDNGSHPSSRRRIQEYAPDPELINTGANLGYAGGNNVGIHLALERGYDFVLILNNDLTVEKELVAKLLAAFERDSQIGLAGPKVYRSDRPDTLFYPAWRIDWNKWLFHRVESDVDPSGITDVDFVQGCAVMMRRELLETVGCFDERFHLYCEDADLSVRAQRAGWRTVEVEDARVWHDGYGSSGRLSALRIYYGLRNRLLFIAKHASPDRRFALRWRLLFFDAGRSFFKGLRLLTKGRFREGARFLRALNRGLWDGLFGRYHAGPKWLFKRRQRRLE